MKYRKKPVEVEAIQWTGDNKEEIADFVGESAMFCKVKYLHNENPSFWRLEIKTLEGKMKADRGDYIVKGVKGEFYPCKPDVFEQTYDKCSFSSVVDDYINTRVLYRFNKRNELEVKVFKSIESYNEFISEFEEQCIGFDCCFDETRWNLVKGVNIEVSK